MAGRICRPFDYHDMLLCIAFSAWTPVRIPNLVLVVYRHGSMSFAQYQNEAPLAIPKDTRMKKLVGALVIIVVVAAAGLTGAAYWSGRQAERWYQESLAAGAANPNIKFSTTQYHRGLFSSQVVTRVQFVMPEDQSSDTPDPSFSVRQDIYHGPLPLAGWGVPGIQMHWTGGVVRTTLDSDSSAWTRALAKWYGHQEPLLIVSQIGFDGASDTHITMPPLNLSNVEDLQSLQFSGLQGQFQIAAHNAAVQGNLVVKSLDTVGKSAAAEGQSANGEVQVKLQDMTMTVNQRKGAFDLLFGDSSFKLGELSIREPGIDTPFVLNNLTITGSVSQQSPQQVGGEVVMKADKFMAEGQSGTGSLKLALRNLDGATVTQLEQWQQKAASHADDPQMLDDLLKLVHTLLRGKPEFMLDSQATLNDGEWQGKLSLNFQDFGDVNLLQSPTGLLGALEKGVAELTVSKGLLETALTDALKEELKGQLEEQGQEASDQAVQTMAAQQTAAQLKSVTDMGFIRLDGNRYRSTAKFEGGKLYVNDKEIPLTATVGEQDANGDETTLEDGGVDGGGEDANAEDAATPQQ